MESTAVASGGQDARAWFGMRRRALVWAAAGVCFALFYELGRVFAIPEHGEAGASLFWPGGAIGAVINVLLIAVGFVAAVVVGSLITRSVRFEAGFVAAALGLGALSARGGVLGDVLRTEGAGPGVFGLLAVEVVGLGAAVLAGWAALRGLAGQGWVKADAPGRETFDDSIGQKITALAAHMLIVFTALSLLARTDAKAQVWGAVFLGSLLATGGAYSLFPVRHSVWYWASPILVGCVGYLIAWAAPEGWVTGQLQGALAPLARPLPLDYASAGPAGAVLGLWMAEGWGKESSRQSAVGSGQ